MIPAPESLRADHELGTFDCRIPTLDDWLKRRALANNENGATRTYVATDQGRVIAYYSLASNGLHLNEATGRFRRNMPDPIPVVVLARLAVDRTYQGKGLGGAMLRDCSKRVLEAGEIIGIRGMIVHAISNDAKAFYEAMGFKPSPISPMTLMTTMADIRANL